MQELVAAIEANDIAAKNSLAVLESKKSEYVEAAKIQVHEAAKILDLESRLATVQADITQIKERRVEAQQEQSQLTAPVARFFEPAATLLGSLGLSQYSAKCQAVGCDLVSDLKHMSPEELADDIGMEEAHVQRLISHLDRQEQLPVDGSRGSTSREAHPLNHLRTEHGSGDRKGKDGGGGGRSRAQLDQHCYGAMSQPVMHEGGGTTAQHTEMPLPVLP
jgi:hypothetical protein